ncbi:aspartate/glutamate racemase family protein [soil metagenome]
MNIDIAFLHTAQAHVRTFGSLMAELAPALRVHHVVAEDLLAQAMKDGADNAALMARVHRSMDDAASTGAKVVVCTCSTIGGLAEAAPTAGRNVAARIDRAMADEAVASGRRVLVVAALESTLMPTHALIVDSARKLGAAPVIVSLLVPDAWAHFMAGDVPAYVNAVASAVASQAMADDIVVLAQASMAPAAALLRANGIDALSSPRLGVQRAIALVQPTGA